jgi:hypothetical protein
MNYYPRLGTQPHTGGKQDGCELPRQATHTYSAIKGALIGGSKRKSGLTRKTTKPGL